MSIINMTNIISCRMQLLHPKLSALYLSLCILTTSAKVGIAMMGADFLVIWGRNKCTFQIEGKLIIVTKRAELYCLIIICPSFLTFLMVAFCQGHKHGYSTEFGCRPVTCFSQWNISKHSPCRDKCALVWLSFLSFCPSLREGHAPDSHCSKGISR